MQSNISVYHDPKLLAALKTVCDTAIQSETIAEMEKTGSIHKTAGNLGKSKSTIKSALHVLDRKLVNAGRHPYAIDSPNPPSTELVKTTVHIHSHKGVIEEWRRLVPGTEEVKAWAQAMAESVRGAIPSIPAPPNKDPHGITRVWFLADHHLGMRAWGRETGSDDYDLGIGLDLLRKAASWCLPIRGEVERMVIVGLGDLWHADQRTPQTERSGNILDVDSRWAKALREGCMALRMVIEEAAKRAQKVDMYLMPGNHDYHTTIAATDTLRAAYEKTPRIHIHDTLSGMNCMAFGKTMLTFSHGEEVAPRMMQAAVSSRFSKEWGETEFRYSHHGHIHKSKRGGYIVGRDEVPGLIVEHHSILPPPDAWAASKCFSSQRATEVVDYWSEFGERRRERVTAEMLMTKKGGK